VRIALGSSCCYCALFVDSVDVHTSSAVTTTLISITAALILRTRCAVLRTNAVCRLRGRVKSRCRSSAHSGQEVRVPALGRHWRLGRFRLHRLRSCDHIANGQGWEGVVAGYERQTGSCSTKGRACCGTTTPPGMKAVKHRAYGPDLS